MDLLRRLLSAFLALTLAVGPAAAQVSPFENIGEPIDEEMPAAGAPVEEAPPAAASPEAAPQEPEPVPPTAPSVPAERVPLEEARPLPESMGSVTRDPVSPLDTRVTVRVKDAPLATFLDSISAQARVNFIIAKGLERVKVTAFLQNVKVREALQVLLEMEGISYERVGKTNTFTIRQRTSKEIQKVTRIYTLNYISLISLAGATEAAISLQSSGQGSGGVATAGSAPSSGGGGSQQGESQAQSAVPFLNVITSILSPHGRVEIEPRTNSLIITDVPESFPQVEQIIAELDKKIPQVMIEAQIVEVNLDRLNEMGIEWGGSRGELATYIGPATLTDAPLRGSRSFFLPPGELSFLDSGESGGGGAAAANFLSSGKLSTEGVFYGIFSLQQLTAVLRALVSRSDARFLGKPKVTTLNNQPAIIKLERMAAVGQSTSVTGVGGGTSQNTTAERFRIGVNLRVTPQVNRDGYVTLLVQPQFSDVIQSPVSTNLTPVFDPVNRAVSTLVRVKNGQTMVLGGLLQNRENKVVRKVPLLGYIPILGWLFTSTSSRIEKTDVVVFITPTIVND